MKKIILFYFLIILVGCVQNSQFNLDEKKEDFIDAETVNSILKVNKIDKTYLLHYFEDKYEYSKYEPEEKCYLGAYILSNKKVDYDIKSFENIVEKPHSLYMYNLKSGETILENWILDCISNMKTPYIVLKIEEDTSELEVLIENISMYNIPVFIQISTLDVSVDPQKYINFYRNASNLIRTKMPNAAIVWSVESTNVYESLRYYPGDLYVDWIGLEVMKILDDKGNYRDDDIEQYIEQFYYTYQKKKPLLISKFAISHFTTYDHVYRINEASEEIINMYDCIANKYPRIKGIIYLDFNGLEVKTKNKSKDNFSVTDNEKMLSTYKSAIGNKRFAFELQNKNNARGELITSQYKIYEIEKELYISKKSINTDFGVKQIPHYGDERFLEGDTYFKIKDIEKLLNGRFYIEEKTQKIIFS